MITPQGTRAQGKKGENTMTTLKEAARTLPEKTYILRFTNREDGVGIEEQEITNAKDAWEGYRIFAAPDCAEFYTRIDLLEFNWKTHQETKLASMDFEQA